MPITWSRASTHVIFVMVNAGSLDYSRASRVAQLGKNPRLRTTSVDRAKLRIQRTEDNEHSFRELQGFSMTGGQDGDGGGVARDLGFIWAQTIPSSSFPTVRS